MRNGSEHQANSVEDKGGISKNRPAAIKAVSRNRMGVALALALSGLSMGSCASVRESERVAPHAVSVVDPTLSFMNEPERRAADRILALPCDDMRETIRSSRALEIPQVLNLIDAVADLQSALREGDPKKISGKARFLISLAESMEQGESERKFMELSGNIDTAFEVLLFQDYMVPALQGSLKLTQFGG